MNVRPPASFRRLAVATAVLVYLLIVMGGIVRVTGSGLGCADSWPSCNGSLLPAATPQSVIEFLHRSITVLSTMFVVLLLAAAWLTQRRHRRIVGGATAAAVLLVVQIALGAIAVKYSLPGGVVMIHLANALLVLGALVFTAVIAETTGTTRACNDSLLPRLTGIATVATYLLAMSGALVVETRSSAGCNGWPLCGGGFQLPVSSQDTINMVHRVVAGIMVLLIGAVMGVVIRRMRERRGVRTFAMLVNAIIVLQVAAGALVVDFRLPAAAQGLHVALASGLWATVLTVTILVRRTPLPQREPLQQQVIGSAPRPSQVGAGV
ncbi:MAG: heme A synthase [Candidatus Dormibacteraeota bacterium]|nr:heme A synthase [Candidatus Dormibacteraeota bacterium]